MLFRVGGTVEGAEDAMQNHLELASNGGYSAVTETTAKLNHEAGASNEYALGSTFRGGFVGETGDPTAGPRRLGSGVGLKNPLFRKRLMQLGPVVFF
jgi:hypothetical protein